MNGTILWKKNAPALGQRYKQHFAELNPNLSDFGNNPSQVVRDDARSEHTLVGAAAGVILPLGSALQEVQTALLLLQFQFDANEASTVQQQRHGSQECAQRRPRLPHRHGSHCGDFTTDGHGQLTTDLTTKAPCAMSRHSLPLMRDPLSWQVLRRVRTSSFSLESSMR